MITVAQARTGLENRKKDITDVSSSVFLEWCNTINNFAYRHLIGTDPERYISETTISVVSGTSDYDLPATFNNVQVLGTGLYERDSNNIAIDTQRLPVTGVGSQQYGYYISGAYITITPTPASSYTLSLRYIPNLTQLTATSDSLVIDQPYLLYVINALDVLYSIWDEDKNNEAFADARFVRSLSELVNNMRYGVQIVSIPNVSNY